MARTILLGFFLCGASATAYAQDRQVVAVFELEAKGVKLDSATLDRLTDYLCSLLAAEPKFQVVPRAQVKERLRGAKSNSYRACFDESCQIEIGRELSAQKTLNAQVLKLASQCKVSVTLYDLMRASSDGAANESGGCDEEALVASLERAMASLLGKPVTPQVIQKVDLKLQARVLNAVPKEMRVDGSAVPTDIEPDLLVLFEAALAKDKEGAKKAPEILKTWREVATFKKGKNPFRAQAQSRVKQWQKYVADRTALERQHEKDRDKLKKLLGLTLMKIEQKEQLLRGFMERYALTFGLSEIETLLTAASPPENKVLREHLFSRVFFDRLCKAEDKRACEEIARLDREAAAAAVEAKLQQDLARNLDEGWVVVEGVVRPMDWQPVCQSSSSEHDTTAYFWPEFIVPYEPQLPSNKISKVNFKAKCLGRYYLVLRPDGYATGPLAVSTKYENHGLGSPSWSVPAAKKGRQCALKRWERAQKDPWQTDTIWTGEYRPREYKYVASLMQAAIDRKSKQLCLCNQGDFGFCDSLVGRRNLGLIKNSRVLEWSVKVSNSGDRLGCTENCVGAWGGDCDWSCNANLMVRCAAELDALDFGSCTAVDQ